MARDRAEELRELEENKNTHIATCDSADDGRALVNRLFERCPSCDPRMKILPVIGRWVILVDIVSLHPTIARELRVYCDGWIDGREQARKS